jgi:hypothetical protein
MTSVFEHAARDVHAPLVQETPMRRTAFTSILLATATAAALGCVDDDSALPEGAIDDVSDDEPAPDDADGVAYTPQGAPGAGRGGAPPGDDPALAETGTGTGRTHEVRVELPGGVTTVIAEERDGALVVEGDMQIGDVADLRRRSAFTSNLTRRWPSGVIPYAFDGSWSTNATDTATQADIRAAMDRIAQRSPLRFVERDGQAGYLLIKKDPQPAAQVGYRGNAQNYQADENTVFGSLMHELLHSAGVFHEQSRPDRDDTVRFFAECVRAGTNLGNWTVETSADTASRFDFRSIMLYGSTGFCAPDTADRDGDGNRTECGFRNAAGTDRCWTLENTSDDCPAGVCVDEDGDGVREVIRSQRDDLGTEDINGLFAMYGAPLGAAEQGDQLGQAIATGDFDGDGYQDVAVGAPYEAPSADPKSGAVFLFRGTRLGLQPWRSITQETRAVQRNGTLAAKLGNNDLNDGFGQALAVGDFNGDGVDDLAVGVPGETYEEGTSRAGAVMIFVGHRGVVGDARHGLQPWFYLGQNDIGASVEADDRFGSALAAGNFDGSGADELAVGSPGEASPGLPRSGAVFVVKGGSTISRWLTFTPSNFFAPSLEGQYFGATLAAGDIDADGEDDLVAGAPGHKHGNDAGAGAVAFFQGGSTLGVWRWDYEPSIGAHHAFGNGLALGNLDGRAGAEITVTAPLHDGGRVYVYRLADGASYPTAWKTLTQSNLGVGDDVYGDLFGQSVAIGDVDSDGKNDIVAGAPRQIRSGQPVGQAIVIKGTGAGFTLIAGTPLGYDGIGMTDGLGSKVAIANIDARGRREILVTAPGADEGTVSDVGAFFQYEVGETVGEEARVDQRTKGAHAD